MCINCDTLVKSELIHIRISPETKKGSEAIFEKLGVNMSYAVSMFLNQVIMRKGFPFEVEVKEGTTEEELLASAIESTGGNGKVSSKNQRILHLFSTGQIDYETALFAIKRDLIS